MLYITSTGTKTALSPSSLANLLPCDVPKSQTTTLAPSLKKFSTVAFPKPDAPPVTKVTAF